MKFIRLMAVSVIALASLSCGGTETSAPASGVGAIVITPPSPTLALNATLALQAEVKDAAGAVVADPVVVWSVRDPSIASVTSTGLVTALKLGTTEVAASSSGKSALTTITVQRTPVASVVVRPDRVDAVVGSRTQLTATALDAAQNTLAGRGIIWTTSNAGVATVDASGVVTGVAAGAAVVTATSEGKSASSTFTIVQGAVASVTVAPNPVDLVAGTTTQLAATARDANGALVTGKPVVWSSSSTAVASVSSQGVVTAVGAGTTTITATIEGASGTAAVSVTNVPVATVAVTPQTPSVTAGTSAQLTAVLRDAGGTTLSNRVVTWVSSNPAVATVSGTGVVTGLLPGTTVVTATSETKSGSTTVTVTLVPVGNVAVSPSTLALTTGQSGNLTAAVTDASGNTLPNRAVTWTSSDNAIATVSPTGVVTGVAAGSATVTASSGGKSGTAAVTVASPAPVPVASVSVSPTSLSLTTGQSGTLTATPKDAGGTPLPNRPIAWSSSNAGVASVDQAGVVTAVSQGTANISASSGGQTGSASVTVGAVPVSTVSVSAAPSPFNVGQTATLTATVVDANGATVPNASVAWSSSNGSVVSVSSSGVITGVSAGTANITASSGGQSGTTGVTVSAVAPTGPGPAAVVTVSPTTKNMKKGDKFQFTATAVDAQNRPITGRAFTWTSSSNSQATVDSSGLVSAKKSALLVVITAKLDNASASALVSVQ